MCLFLGDERLESCFRDVIHFIHHLLRKLEDELVLNDCADPSSPSSSISSKAVRNQSERRSDHGRQDGGRHRHRRSEEVRRGQQQARTERHPTALQTVAKSRDSIRTIVSVRFLCEIGDCEGYERIPRQDMCSICAPRRLTPRRLHFHSSGRWMLQPRRKNWWTAAIIAGFRLYSSRYDCS